MMIEKVSETIRESCGVGINEKIVMGFSGGADSVCLLEILG